MFQQANLSKENPARQIDPQMTRVGRPKVEVRGPRQGVQNGAVWVGATVHLELGQLVWLECLGFFN